MNAKVSDTETVSRFDGLKWLCVVSIIALGAYANHHFADESLLYRVIGLIVLGVVAIVVSMQTAKGAAAANLLVESRAEIRKVVWPNRQETTQTTLIVVVAVLIMGILLWALDSLLSWSVNSLIA